MLDDARRPANVRRSSRLATVSVVAVIRSRTCNPVLTPTAIIVTMIAASDVTPYDGLWTSEGYPIQIDA